MKASLFILKTIVFGITSVVLLLLTAAFSSAPFAFKQGSLYHIDKILLYVCVYYFPFVSSYFLVRLGLLFTRLDRTLCYPGLIVYLSWSLWLFVTKTWWARGMEVESRSFYLLLLFVPPVIVLVLKLRKSVGS